jgi:hypothetical protein
VVAACTAEVRSGDPDLQVSWAFEPDPPTVGPVDVRVGLADVDWTPRNGAVVVLTGLRDDVELFSDTAVGRGAGSYVAEDVRFEVAGAWTLRARVRTADGRTVEVDNPVTVVAPGG